MTERQTTGTTDTRHNEQRFKPCCGHPPIVTEWRPGCYGAECATCGRILGAGRQVRENDLMAEWNNEQRKERTSA